MAPTDSRGPGPPSSVVASWPELLAATGTEDIESLSAVVTDACEPDVWVADTDAGVEIGSGLWVTCLAFPFPIATFWALVREVEREEVARIEATAGRARPAGWPLRLVER